MAIQRCPAGHPYSDKLPVCPVCQSELSLIELARRPPEPERPSGGVDAPSGVERSGAGSSRTDSGAAAPSAEPPRARVPAPDEVPRVRAVPADRRLVPVVGVLVALDGGDPGRFYALFEGRNLIGKASNPESTIPIPGDDRVSKRHAAIDYQAEDGAVFLLRDVGSLNGTWLNGDTQRLAPEAPAALLPGDVVRVGRTHLRFQPFYP